MRLRAFAVLSSVVSMTAAAACTVFNGVTLPEGAADGGEAGAPSDASTADVDAASPNDAASAYEALVLAARPVAYYRLDDVDAVAHDRGSAHADGYYGANVVRQQPGLLSGDTDTAAAFTADGGAASIILARRSAALEPTSRITVECWMRSNAALPARLVSYGSDVPSDGYEAWVLQIDVNGTPTPVTTFYSGRLQRDTFGATSLVAGRVYHLVGTYDGAKMQVYVNGSLDGQLDVTGALGWYDAGAGLGLGGGTSGGGSQLAGTLDEVAIYDYALDAPTIRQHYVVGSSAH